MGNEQSKKARASSSSSSTGSKSAKNPLSVLKSGPSNSKIQSHLANAQKKSCSSTSRLCFYFEFDFQVAGILRNLDLSQNKIISIPARVGQFASLKQLNFSHNRLEELPDEIGCLKTLETLDVSNNRLTCLPDSLAGCSSLKILNASNNAISVFPTSVCHAFQIEHLDFSCNEITSLPDEIAHLTAVELNLNRNRLSSLNESLADCKNLRVFRVEENCLEKKAFSKKILGSSSISLITYSGNLFQDTEFQDLPGYDQYQVHRMPFDSRKRKTDLSLLSTDTPTTSKQRLHETRHPDIKQGTTEESPSKSNETVRSRLRSSADYKFVPELTADLAVLPKPCTNLIRGPTVISIYALRPQSVRFETNLPRRKLQPSSESSDRKSRSSIVVEKYEENEPSKVHDEQRTLKRETIGEYSKLDALQLSHHSKRDPFSPEARTPSPNLLNITTPATNVPAKRGRGRPRKSTVVRTSSVPQDKKPKRPSSSFVTPRRTLLPSSRRISHLHLRDDHFGSASKSAKGTVRLLEPENLFRNQSDYHSCIVCKEQTLLPTAEFERSIRKGETKAAEPGPDEMTLAEDPAMFCVKCKKCFHLTCVYDEILLQNWATENPTNFVCQQCIRCSKCSDPIFDPGNVQCVTCGKAFHETCKPSTQMIHDFPSISRVWYCQVCEKHIMEILDHKESVPLPTEEEKKPSTSKLVYKTKERPTVKKEKKSRRTATSVNTRS
ncbi:Leucine-rich repeat-containing protein 57 [Aphelenchoides besseyi]|nr:Leucine-rich repeat-containing protein 57 [Aphelenchoides besseyi]